MRRKKKHNKPTERSTFTQPLSKRPTKRTCRTAEHLSHRTHVPAHARFTISFAYAACYGNFAQLSQNFCTHTHALIMHRLLRHRHRKGVPRGCLGTLKFKTVALKSLPTWPARSFPGYGWSLNAF